MSSTPDDRHEPRPTLELNGHTTWRIALGAASYFVGLACVLGLCGPGTEALRSIEVTLAATIAIALCPEGSPRFRTFGAVLAIATFLWLPNDFARQVAYVAVGIGLSGRNRIGLGRCALAVLGGQVFLDTVPGVRGLVERGAGSLSGLPHAPGDVLSLTAHGGLLLLAAWLFLGCELLPRRPWWFLGIASAAACTWVLQFELTALLLGSVGPYWEHGHSPPGFSNLLVLALLLGSLVGMAHAVGGRRSWTMGPQGIPVALASALAVLGFVIPHALFGMPLLLEPPQRSVAFLNLGGMDWERPGPEEVGAWSGGMFGLLPVYMRSAGWECRAVDPEDLVDTLSGDTQVLAIINSPHQWTDEERSALCAHLDRGGGLLALGDHTDIFGLQRGFNTVLPDYGIEFRFDSAYHDGHSWVGNMVSGFGLPQPSRKAADSSIAIGASLDIRGPAVPWIWGRYGFSDRGLRSNVQGAFLGNYKYERTERLGDLVVAASAYHGRGAVLAYGDTTAFQNGILSSSFTAHVGPVMDWLSRPSRVHRRFLLVGAAVAMLFLGVCGILVTRREGLAQTCLIAAVVGGLLIGAATSGSAMSAPPLDASEPPLFLMDYSNAPRVGDYGIKANDPWPLAAAALRTGFLSIDMNEWRSDLLEQARCVALIAPQMPLTVRRQGQLHALMTRGGCVVVAASGSDADAINEFLLSYGMHIEASSIGSVPPRHLQDPKRPRLIDASHVMSLHGEHDRYVLGSPEEPYFVAHPVGTGWLVVAGDSRAFSTRNVEGMWGEWPANTRLLMDLLIEFAGGSPTPPETLLPAAVKVDAFGEPVKGLGHL